ncbi:NUDIX domain-containing protein [Lentilactobacillus hilgardii]|uniref:NUDIX domain-containing protein n=1 Tax=Lentilactobacillus hilgardii TaxID=1588 RepID=UPI0039EA0424
MKKNGGPYINRYDLPGGSLEDGEALQNAIIRKIKEETGLVLKEITQLGIKSFRYPWTYQKWQYNQHIYVFYQISFTVGGLKDQFLNLLVKIP